jgi:hypothetical protein
MSVPMRGRHVLVVASCSFVLLGIACVDLFHGTDFETLCTASPDDPACSNDASAAADVDTERGTVDAAHPHPDFCAWSAAEARSQALRACAWLGACEGPLGESAFGPCAVRAQLAFDCGANPSLRPRGAVDAFWACLATVTSCADVDRCVFPAGVQDCVAVPTSSSLACGTTTNSGVRLECAGPAGRARGIEPCVMLGKTCSPEDTSTATCTGALAFDCTTDVCSGTSAVDCTPAGVRSLDRGLDCAGYGGGTCVRGDGGLLCAAGASAPTCTTETLPHCDGNVATSCVAGREIRVDCARVGLACSVADKPATFDPAAACGIRTAGACTAADACNGDTVKSCGRGALHELNCASVGLGKCALGASGRAACSPP